MANMATLFTPIDDLRRQEPEYFTMSESATPQEKSESQLKTPAMLLDEATKKIYSNETPIYRDVGSEGSAPNLMFTMECRVRTWTGLGRGKQKKIAKQYAAAEISKKIIHDYPSYLEHFGMADFSKEEAIAYIDQSLEKLTDINAGTAAGSSTPTSPDDLTAFSRDKDYSGALLQLCQKKNLEAPTYEDRDDGTQNEHCFVVKCTVGKMSAEGKGRKKKDAKAIASYRMFTQLEKSLSDMNSDFDDLLPDENDEGDDEVQSRRPSTVNPHKTVEEILSDKTKFTSYQLEYRILEKMCSFGIIQCLLKMNYVRAGETSKTTTIFPGFGDDEEEAKRSAALAALYHLETF